MKEDVSVSCDFASAIQKCIIDLEMALKSDTDIKEGVKNRQWFHNLQNQV